MNKELLKIIIDVIDTYLNKRSTIDNDLFGHFDFVTCVQKNFDNSQLDKNITIELDIHNIIDILKTLIITGIIRQEKRVNNFTGDVEYRVTNRKRFYYYKKLLKC